MFPASAGMNRRRSSSASDHLMFPASAGMNPIFISPPLPGDVPRVRGDEPAPDHGHEERVMFPASAGMNRGKPADESSFGDVPRVRGDEPV